MKRKEEIKKNSRNSAVAFCPLSHPHHRRRFQYEEEIFDNVFLTSNFSPPLKIPITPESSHKPFIYILNHSLQHKILTRIFVLCDWVFDRIKAPLHLTRSVRIPRRIRMCERYWTACITGVRIWHGFAYLPTLQLVNLLFDHPVKWHLGL